jgi:hypothetical protein
LFEPHADAEAAMPGLVAAMQRFISTQNLQHFQDLLARETDDAHSALLQRLICEEQAKLDAVAEAERSAGGDERAGAIKASDAAAP